MQLRGGSVADFECWVISTRIQQAHDGGGRQTNTALEHKKDVFLRIHISGPYCIHRFARCRWWSVLAIVAARLLANEAQARRRGYVLLCTRLRYVALATATCTMGFKQLINRW